MNHKLYDSYLFRFCVSGEKGLTGRDGIPAAKGVNGATGERGYVVC